MRSPSALHADAHEDAPVLGDALIPSRHGALDFQGRAHGVYDALKGCNGSVAGALDDATPTPSDGGIEEVTP
jgi:hypothetical protein